MYLSQLYDDFWTFLMILPGLLVVLVPMITWGDGSRQLPRLSTIAVGFIACATAVLAGAWLVAQGTSGSDLNLWAFVLMFTGLMGLLPWLSLLRPAMAQQAVR